MMKKVALIYMGGTFGCVGEPLTPMPAQDFIPQLKKILPIHHNIECFVAPTIKDSSACTPQDWLKLTQFIQSLQLQGFLHFIILHGTDTLSYASAVLAQLIGESAHIIFTGSQYPLLNIDGNDTRKFTDALDNLNYALDAIQTSTVGTYIAFHHQLIHAQTALKRHTTELNAFTGLDADHEIKNESHAFLIQNDHIQKAEKFNCLNWMLQPIEQDLLCFNLNNLLTNPPTCLILQGFGTGNISINAEIAQTLQILRENQCAIILTTQVPFGAIDQRYAISDWTKTAKILKSNAMGHADLYAKTLKMYLKYDSIDQWDEHWND